MTEPEQDLPLHAHCVDDPSQDHDEFHECALALNDVQAFLHGELPEARADEIRAHLMACESCMDDYYIEQMITSLLRRCQPQVHATSQLRMRITSLTVTHRTINY